MLGSAGTAVLISTTELQEPIRTRFAPTPSGFLHLGNAFSFVLTWLLARQGGGTVRLRIDDIDRVRKRAEFVEDIFRSLEWLGLDYDEGPMGPDDFEASFSQQLRLDRYRECIDVLLHNNELFACDCSRSSIQRESPDGQHPVSCRSKLTDFHSQNVCWRCNTNGVVVEWLDADDRPRQVALDATLRDFVVQRKDRGPSYQIASLVDDLDFGINYLVRGEDLLASTAAQIWLARQLREESFCRARFLHHPLLFDNSGRKLSKSAGATSLKSMREAGSSAQLYQRLSPLLGFSEVIDSAQQALAVFRQKA